MHAIQYKHPSETRYRFLKLIDTTEATPRHYAVAIDIYDKRTLDIFPSFLNVLGGKDQVTLIAFGLHPEKFTFSVQGYLDEAGIRDSVYKILSRIETGLNRLVGIRMLEKIKADEYIMITAGCHDRAPLNIKSYLNIMILAPGTINYMGTHNITCFPEHGPYERIIRETFGIPGPKYFGVVLVSKENIYLPSPPNGGSRTLELPKGQTSGLSVTYMIKDGTVKQINCVLEDDETIPYKSDYMKTCEMIE